MTVKSLFPLFGFISPCLNKTCVLIAVFQLVDGCFNFIDNMMHVLPLTATQVLSTFESVQKDFFLYNFLEAALHSCPALPMIPLPVPHPSLLLGSYYQSLTFTQPNPYLRCRCIFSKVKDNSSRSTERHESKTNDRAKSG